MRGDGFMTMGQSIKPGWEEWVLNLALKNQDMNFDRKAILSRQKIIFSDRKDIQNFS
jgi:hypothetical protein